MGNTILGSSNLPIIGANRCSRKRVNKTEGQNCTYETRLGFKIGLNRELSTKLIQKNSLPSTARESQCSDKQKFHSAEKQRCPLSIEVLGNWPFILWLQRTASCAWQFTFLSRQRSITWYKIMHLPISGNFPILHLLCYYEHWGILLWIQIFNIHTKIFFLAIKIMKHIKNVQYDNCVHITCISVPWFSCSKVKS